MWHDLRSENITPSEYFQFRDDTDATTTKKSSIGKFERTNYPGTSTNK
jgi:hypothetical protein